jgi:hypothetical protein
MDRIVHRRYWETLLGMNHFQILLFRHSTRAFSTTRYSRPKLTPMRVEAQQYKNVSLFQDYSQFYQHWSIVDLISISNVFIWMGLVEMDMISRDPNVYGPTRLVLKRRDFLHHIALDYYWSKNKNKQTTQKKERQQLSQDTSFSISCCSSSSCWWQWEVIRAKRGKEKSTRKE